MQLRLDYAIYYLKKNGGHNRKIFAITSGRYAGNSMFKRQRSFRNMTTRVHYPGPHFLSIVVNGRESPKKRFLLGEAIL